MIFGPVKGTEMQPGGCDTNVRDKDFVTPPTFQSNQQYSFCNLKFTAVQIKLDECLTL